jgi:hypothetical protein
MMKKIVLLAIIIAVLVCSAFEGKAKEKRELRPFSEISLRLSANLYVEQAEESSVEIDARQDVIDRMIIEIVDRKLIIRFSYEDMIFGNVIPGKISIHVKSPDIDMLSVAGSGNIMVGAPIETRVMELFIAGSGDIKIADLSCHRLKAEITGSGNIIVSGNKGIRDIEMMIAGSGNIKASQLESEYGKIRIAGSGVCELAVKEYLDAMVVGAGDIRYKGSPELKSSISGSGRIYKIN